MVQTMSRACWLVLALFGCGGNANSTSTSANAPGPQACLPIVPLRLLALEHGREWEPVAELRSDGTLVSAKAGPIGHIENDRVYDVQNRAFLECVGRDLRVPGQPLTAHFDANDDFVDQRSRIHVTDNGEVLMSMGGGPPQSMGRVEGPTRAPRTVAMLVFAALAAGRWDFH